MKYQGVGYYDKYEGELVELGPLTREVEKGEVWEGSQEDFNATFNPDELI